MNGIVKVCIPHTLRQSFDYQCEGPLPVVGARVKVPFRKEEKIGIVVGFTTPENTTFQMKMITEIIDREAMITPSLLTLCEWISQYYQSPLSEVLPLALPKLFRLGKNCQFEDYFELNQSLETGLASIKKNAHKQQALLEAISHGIISKAQLLTAGFTTSQLNGLLDLHLIRKQQRIPLPHPIPNEKTSALPLNTEQAEAVNAIAAGLGSYQCFLLQGITGSGKTEVYLQVIAEVLAKQQQVLILVPEIGLTPQLLQRFSARFDVPMAVFHSNLNESERANAWQLAKENQIKLVIGTRTAVFTPLPQLGLIIIDEEHDASLKQMDGVRYSARDSALMRAYLADIPIILGSATPSLESLHNVQKNKFKRLILNQKALTSTPLRYELVDLRNLPLNNGLTETTLARIQTHLNNQRQVLVFINRRGYAPVLLCHQCGWIVGCRQCDSHLTLHAPIHKLACHHCGLQQQVPKACKQCHGRELIPIGAGTQRIAEFLQQQFPTTKVLRIDRDEVSKKHALAERLEQIHSNETQLIVGTQMLAKGHHFPNLSLVVILDTDYGFYNQDFRALEQLGQLITQVSGRAGRAEAPGEVLLQTHLPNHPLLKLLVQNDYQAFAEALLESRQQALLPPFHYLAVIRAQHRNPLKVNEFLAHIKAFFNQSNLQSLGPAPAPLAKKANQHRMQLLLKSASRKILQETLTGLRDWLTITKYRTSVRWNIDVDPQDLA